MFEWYEADAGEVVARRVNSPAARENPVAFYGSSSIRLWTTLEEDFAGTPVVNLGFGGSTLAACAHYYDRIVSPVAPRSLVLYAGDNDLGDGRMPNEIIASLGDLLARVDEAAPAIPVGFISIKPSVARWDMADRIRAVNTQAQAIMAARPGGVYLDIFTAMLSGSGEPRPELFESDGLHMNRLGYRLWRQVVLSRRGDLLL